MPRELPEQQQPGRGEQADARRVSGEQARSIRWAHERLMEALRRDPPLPLTANDKSFLRSLRIAHD